MNTGPERPSDIVTEDDVVAQTIQFDHGRSIHLYESEITASNLARVLAWLPAAIAWRDQCDVNFSFSEEEDD